MTEATPLASEQITQAITMTGYMGVITAGAPFVMDYGQKDVEELVRVSDVQPADDVCCKVRLEGTTFWMPEIDFRRRATPFIPGTPSAALSASPAPSGQDVSGADWDAKLAELYQWTGSDWLSGGEEGPTDRTDLRVWLCTLIGWFMDASEAAPAPSCAPGEVERDVIAAAISGLSLEQFRHWAANGTTYPNSYQSSVDQTYQRADRVLAALSPQGLDAKEGVTLYREVDALGGTGEGDWHAGYTEALTEVLNILTKRGFTEAADAKDGGQRVAFYWKDGSDIREGESLSDRDRRIYEQGRRDERVGEPEAFQ